MDDTLDVGPGGTVSTWPYLKIARSREHAYELMARVDAWNARRLYRCPIVIASDHATLKVLQVEMPNSPEVEWALCFGDAVHAARVALDALAWEMAHLDGASPRKPMEVTFPIASSEDVLARKLSAVCPHLHPNIAKRIAQVQPFNCEDPGRSWLSIISRFDNEDKHRAAVFTSPSMTGASMYFGKMRMADDVVGDGEARVEWSVPLDSVPPGGELASITLGLRVEEMPSDAHAVISSEATVHLFGELLPAAQVAMDIANWVDAAVTYICLAEISDSGVPPASPFGSSTARA